MKDTDDFLVIKWFAKLTRNIMKGDVIMMENLELTLVLSFAGNELSKCGKEIIDSDKLLSDDELLLIGKLKDTCDLVLEANNLVKFQNELKTLKERMES